MADYVPSNDVEFKTWMTNFLAVLEPIIADFGMVEADLTVLKNFNMTFGSSVDAYVQLRHDTLTASATKKTDRGNLSAILRPLVQRINHHPAMSDGLRQDLGLTPRNASFEVTPIEELVPKLHLESVLGAVTIHWGPTPTNEHINGKPEGVKGANIYRKKAGEADFQVVGYATKSPYYDEISGPASDYTYYVRYRGTKQNDLSNPSAEEMIAARGIQAAA